MLGRRTPFFLIVIMMASPVWAQQVQSLEHDSLNGRENSLVHVDANTYALAYAGNGSDGFIKTFSISADGMTITQVQSFEHDTLSAVSNSLVQVDADTYALAYAGPGLDGFIKTFDISADGTTITQVQSFEHDTLNGTHNSLVRVDADTYALAYAGDGDDGFIKTFDISADGTTITQVQSFEHDNLNGTHNSLVHVDANTYALAYAGDEDDGFIKTFTISADGLTITQVQSVEHDPLNGQYNSLVHVDGNTYALAYAGSGLDGFIKTFSISADGTTVTEVLPIGHDTSLGVFNSLAQVDADTYALAYAGTDFDGFIKTFTISADGLMITEVQSVEHDLLNGQYSSLTQVDADTYALAYAGDGNVGLIKTFTISGTGMVPVTLESFTIE
ncbi:MAG: hypothetical protein DHS20C11_24240 [Lysobacteraceae bacterium]|nr:MAG: hypothetical protein DHS20C11_24240 [Xanthomonadaceae bacterium]